MSVKKKQKALAALLSAMCSVSSAHAGEPKKINNGQNSKAKIVSVPKNQEKNKHSRIKSAPFLGGKNNLDLKKAGVGDFLSKNAGILVLTSTAVAGVVYNAKTVHDYLEERSKSKELEKSASDIEKLKNEVNESENRCDEIEKNKLNIIKNQIAMEGLLNSTDNDRVNPTILKKGSAAFNKLHDLDYKNLENLKKGKTIEDENANSKFKESLNKLTDSLTGIMTKLGTQDEAFKGKLNSSLSNLKPQEGHGVIDLFKAILKSFEEAWCAASLENTKSDTDDTYNNLGTQKARLEYFIDKYLNLLLPMDPDTDGLPKNKNTRKVAIISYLFYKNDAPNQLTIEKFITNSFGDSLIVSKLAKHLQNIRTTFSKVDKPSIFKFLELHSPEKSKQLNKMLDETVGEKQKEGDIFKGTIRNCADSLINKFVYFLLSGENSVAISDASIKNLLGSLVNDGCDNELLPKNFFRILNNYENCNLKKIKEKLINAARNLNVSNSRQDMCKYFTGENKLLDSAPANINSADPSNKILELIKDLFSGEKSEQPGDKDESVLDDFMNKGINQRKELLQKMWENKKLSEAYDHYTKCKAKYPEVGSLIDDDKNLYLSFDKLDYKTWGEKDLDNLKKVHDWNYRQSCEDVKIFGGWKTQYKYNKDSAEWKQALAAFEAIRLKQGASELKLVEPQTANLLFRPAGGYGNYVKPDNKDNLIDNFNKKTPEERKIELEQVWNFKKLPDEYVRYEIYKENIPDDGLLTKDDKNLHLSFDQLDYGTWEPNDLDNLKIVHTWNYRQSCLDTWEGNFFNGKWTDRYQYDNGSEEWANAQAALKAIEPKLGELKLKLVEPQTAKVWWHPSTFGNKYVKKEGA